MLLFAFVMDEKESPTYNKIVIDEDLFEQIGSGDMDALDELYHMTERTMYAFAVSLTRDHEQALDLVQDAFVKIVSAAHLYKPMGKPLAWMFTITKNLFYSYARKEKRSIATAPDEISNDRRFSYVTDMDDRMVLEGVLKKLSQEEREIILLHAVSGLKHREIAELLGYKLSTVLSKYNRSIKKLRSYLQGKGETSS